MRVDPATILGLVAALGGIGAGLVLEGGDPSELLQPTAALIVFGGTIGATLIAQPVHLVLRALRRLGGLLLEPRGNPESAIDEVSELSAEARKRGLLALEKKLQALQDPFLRDAVQLGVDGVAVSELRELMQSRIDQLHASREAEAKVFETAGGFSPTIGIIGAVLGLIQVMKHLDDIDEVGQGIAVAFVATIYGVAFANLALLPAARKILVRADAEAVALEASLEGAVGVIEGKNPRIIRARMESYLRPEGRKPPEEKAEPAEPSAARAT